MVLKPKRWDISELPSSSVAKAFIIAGPNGAGKTTFAREFLPTEGECLTFINADLIAAGLSPFRPEQKAFEASYLMLEQVRQSVTKHEDFAIETTLAGRSYLRMIPQWQKAGYQVRLLFLGLPSVDLAIERVRQRVVQGGHDIPEEDIRRRFERGLVNFQTLYRQIVDVWQEYDASQWPPILLNEGGK